MSERTDNAAEFLAAFDREREDVRLWRVMREVAGSLAITIAIGLGGVGAALPAMAIQPWLAIPAMVLYVFVVLVAVVMWTERH